MADLGISFIKEIKDCELMLAIAYLKMYHYQSLVNDEVSSDYFDKAIELLTKKN